jgi:hypothetical protein
MSVEDKLMGRTTSRELVAVRGRLEAWRRKGGGRGSRLPEPLWNEAVELARVAGVHATARALRLNYERLKERAGRVAAKPAGDASRFVALELPQPNGGAKLMVVLAGPDGEQVRMELWGASGMELVALAQTFWHRRPCSS